MTGNTLEQEIEQLKERNRRVEAEKAWETSFIRIFTLALSTYVIVAAVLYFIGVPDFYLAALIPVIGYLLSTQSLPFVRTWWIRKYVDREI